MLVFLLLVLWFGTIAASLAVQPLLMENFHARPGGAVFPLVSFAAIFASVFLHRRRLAGPAFVTSAVSLYAMIGSAAAGLYPYVLPARMAQHGLTVSQVASSPESLTLALYWWIPGMILVGVYTYFVYVEFLPKSFPVPREEH